MSATLTGFKREGGSDYHLVLEDASGNTMIARIPCPCCVGSASPFGLLVASARAKFDSRFTVTESLQNTSVPVLIRGVGLFGVAQGQAGAAPNGIELHPVLDISFDVGLRKPVIVSAQVSGKKLHISGLNFDEGATIFVGDQKQKTANDSQAPALSLTGKKAGKLIDRGQTVTLIVKNGDGSMSEPFSFRRPDQ